MTMTERAPRRVRHPLVFRHLEVLRVTPLTPHMLRITLSGPELEGFATAGFDDHVKLFFPLAGQEKPILPQAGPNGPIVVFGDGAELSPRRDYTPRRFDAAARELDIDFALHGEGPGTGWAAQARPGQWLGLGGPRGSFIVPDDFDWYLLAGDETALPAIGRRLEELPPSAHALVVAQVANAAERLSFGTQARLDLHWVHRDEGQGLERAVAGLPLPAGTGHAWVACEAQGARALRRHLVEERGLPREHVRAAGYWKQGSADAHESLND